MITCVTQGGKTPSQHRCTQLSELLAFLRKWVLNLCGGVCDTPSAYDEPEVRPFPARVFGISAAAFTTMLCLQCRLQVGMNENHCPLRCRSRHPPSSPCRFLHIHISWKMVGMILTFFFFLAMLPENRREPSKSFDSYSIQRLGYNLHLREPLNCGAGMGRCNRRRNTISVLCFCTWWQDNGHEEHVVIPMFKRGLNCTYTLLKSPPDIQCSETVPLNIKKVTELLSAFSQFPGTKQIKMDNSKTCCKQVFHILLQGTGTVPGSPSSIDKAFGIEHRYLGCLFLCLCL